MKHIIEEVYGSGREASRWHLSKVQKGTGKTYQ